MLAIFVLCWFVKWMSFSDTPDYVDKAEYQIERALRWDVYDAECRKVNVSEDWYIACDSDGHGGEPWALYAVVAPQLNGTYFHAISLNGKGSQFADEGVWMRRLDIDTSQHITHVDVAKFFEQ